MRALIGRLNGSSPKKPSKPDEKTHASATVEEGNWPKGDSNKDARKSSSTLGDAHSPLSSPQPSTLSPRLQINRYMHQDVMTNSCETLELQTEVQALTKSLGEMHRLLLASRSEHEKCKKELKEVCNRIDRMTQHQFSKYKDRLEDIQIITEKRVEELKQFYEMKIDHLQNENSLLREIVQSNDISRKWEKNYMADNNDSIERKNCHADAVYENKLANEVASDGIDSSETGSMRMYENVNKKAIASTSKDSLDDDSKKNLQSPKKVSKFKKTQSISIRNYGKEVYEKWRNEKSLANDSKRTERVDMIKIESDANHQISLLQHSIFSLFELLDAVYMENDTLHGTVDFLNKELLTCTFENSIGPDSRKSEETDDQKGDAGEAMEFDNMVIDRLLTTQEFILTALRIQNNPKKIGQVVLDVASDNDESSSNESMKSLKASLLELHSILKKCRSKNHTNDLKTLQLDVQLEDCKYKEEKIREDYKNLQKFVKKYKGHIAAILRQRHEDFMDAKEKSLNIVYDLRNVLLGNEMKSSDDDSDEILSSNCRSPLKISKYLHPVKVSQVPDANDDDFSAPYTSAKLNKAGIHFTKMSL